MTAKERVRADGGVELFQELVMGDFMPVVLNAVLGINNIAANSSSSLKKKVD